MQCKGLRHTWGGLGAYGQPKVSCLPALQVLHRLPLRRRHPMSFHVPVNMRGAKRLPPGDGSFPQLPSSALGNPLHVLPFTDTQPAGSSLGCMAGMVRTSLEDRWGAWADVDRERGVV